MDCQKKYIKREKYYFNQGYARLVLYLTNHTNANTAKDLVCSDGFYMGAWFLYFRGKWQNDELDASMVHRLELIGVTIVDAEEGFIKMAEKFEKYVKEFGTNQVPLDYKTDDGCMLGAWVNRQKMCYYNMTKEKQAELLRLGVV